MIDLLSIELALGHASGDAPVTLKAETVRAMLERIHATDDYEDVQEQLTDKTQELEELGAAYDALETECKEAQATAELLAPAA